MIKLTNNLEEAKFVTHAGNFHADDVFSTMFMERLFDNITLIRLNDYKDDGTKIAYVSRMGQNENRLDELHILDLKTLQDSLLRTDEADFRYTWGDISWQPEGKGVMLLALKDMDRTYTNVLYIDLATRSADLA